MKTENQFRLQKLVRNALMDLAQNQQEGDFTDFVMAVSYELIAMQATTIYNEHGNNSQKQRRTIALMTKLHKKGLTDCLQKMELINGKAYHA